MVQCVYANVVHINKYIQLSFCQTVSLTETKGNKQSVCYVRQSFTIREEEFIIQIRGWKTYR